jgi:hypothetical protein
VKGGKKTDMASWQKMPTTFLLKVVEKSSKMSGFVSAIYDLP